MEELEKYFEMKKYCEERIENIKEEMRIIWEKNKTISPTFDKLAREYERIKSFLG